VYVDYRLIDNVKREEAIECYRDSIDELLHDETVLRRKRVEQEEKEAQRIIHKVCCVLLPKQELHSENTWSFLCMLYLVEPFFQVVSP